MSKEIEISNLIGRYAGKLKYKLDKLNNMILSWSIMLDSPDFDGTDASLVKEEMLDYIVDGIKDVKEVQDNE